MHFGRSSVCEMENFFAKVGNISLFKNPKRDSEFTERIVNISGVTFVFSSGKIRPTGKIPMTGFFITKDLVIKI